MKIIDTFWMTGKGTVGLVACENDMGERKFYIGTGEGFNKEFDSQNIADWGLRVNKEMFDRFFDRNSK